MAYINPAQLGLALQVRGKIGLPNGYGESIFGYSQYADKNPYSGVYQMRYRNLLPLGYLPDKKSAKIQVRMRYSWPYNPKTVIQQATRTKFQSGMQAWGALTPAEKEPWIRKGMKLRTRGNALFMKKYMLDEPLNP